MSADKPTGGDEFPERFSMRDDRPFPGAPENREPAPELPENTLSMDELRAVYERSNSLAELQAEARAYEEAQARAAGSSDSPGSGFPESASVGEGPAEVGADSTGHLDAHPGVQDAGVDGSAQADQPEDLSPLPGAPEDREPALALPDNTPSVDDLRAMHQKARSSAELEAIAPEYPAAQKEPSVPGPGREQVLDGQNGFFGRPGDLQDQDATEPGERDVDERTGPDTGTSADTLPQPNRGEKPSDEKDSGGQGDDGQDQQTKDLVQVQHQAPETEIGRPAEAASEAVPDQQPDDPRLAAMERQMERMMATVEAMQQKLEASEARHEEDKAGFEQKLGDLQAENSELKQKIAELETGQREGRSAPDRSPDSSNDLESSITDDVTEPATRPDLLGGDGEADADTADLVAAANSEADQEAARLPSKPDRSGYSPETVDFWKSAAGVVQAAGFTFPGADLITGGEATRQAFEKMTPDEQIATVRMGDAAGNAIGGMYPGAALAALGLSIVLPVAQDKFRSMADKLRRRDQDAG